MCLRFAFLAAAFLSLERSERIDSMIYAMTR